MPSPAHYPVPVQELRKLGHAARAACSTSNLPFIRHIKRFLEKCISSPSTLPRTEVLIPNSTSDDIAMNDRILDTSAFDVYHHNSHCPSRAGLIQRLRHILVKHQKLMANALHSSPHRRYLAKRSRSTLDKEIGVAKRQIWRIEDDVLYWHAIHLNKDRWRRALINNAPALERHIVHLDPTRDQRLRALQIEVLEGWPPRIAYSEYLPLKLRLEDDLWRSHLAELVPAVRNYIIHFYPPADSFTRHLQSHIFSYALGESPPP